MFIVPSIYLRFYIEVGVGVGTFLPTPTPRLRLQSPAENRVQTRMRTARQHLTIEPAKPSIPLFYGS
jgi:hypothetical protein